MYGALALRVMNRAGQASAVGLNFAIKAICGRVCDCHIHVYYSSLTRSFASELRCGIVRTMMNFFVVVVE